MSAAAARLAGIAASRNKGGRGGFTSVCSAHPLVIEAALRHGLENEADVLIEATCNQVNQEGGYTGMTPADFRRIVEGIAATIGFDPGRLVLGGDHLGPNPWRHLPAGEAMGKAAAMIGSYAAAGFAKLHLDTSMGCAGEPEALADAETAKRAARLAGVAESAAREAGTAPPVYVVGTEVPVPGGAWHALDHLQVTVPDAALRTIAVHREAFRAKGLEGAFERAIAAVVQPGVEFGHADVVTYNRAKAVALSAALAQAPQFVFEAHSTDYQPRQALRSLVEDGFAILKVGPALTFALREALYGLSHIAEILAPDPNRESLPIVMERVMLSSPDNWRKYYPGSETEQRVQRHFSLSDRIRYYWPEAEAGAAVARLMTVLGESSIPSTLISQHLAHLHEGVRLGHVRPVARDLAIASVFRVLDDYAFATRV